MNKITAIGFDADDTLWHNEHYFSDAQATFKDVMRDFIDSDGLSKLLLEREQINVKILGYGIKSFTLSMMETALSASNHQLNAHQMQKVIDIGREMTAHPVKLLDGVRDVLAGLAPDYELVLITKGDLVDQERKVIESNISDFFHSVEIVSEKRTHTYSDIFARHGGAAHSVMIGNSVKSDVLPAVAAGAWGIHVPYATTWELEYAVPDTDHDRYFEANDITHAARIIREL